jgi:hypothetical protein
MGVEHDNLLNIYPAFAGMVFDLQVFSFRNDISGSQSAIASSAVPPASLPLMIRPLIFRNSCLETLPLQAWSIGISRGLRFGIGSRRCSGHEQRGDDQHELQVDRHVDPSVYEAGLNASETSASTRRWRNRRRPRAWRLPYPSGRSGVRPGAILRFNSWIT